MLPSLYKSYKFNFPSYCKRKNDNIYYSVLNAAGRGSETIVCGLYINKVGERAMINLQFRCLQ